MKRFTQRATAAAFIAILLALFLRAADTLPARLSDVEFWHLIDSMSEPTGSWPWENVVSNEIGVQHVIPALKKATQPGGVYIGVGPEQNFTFIAALRPKIAFIVDIRRQNMIEHLMYKAIFEVSANRTDFVSRLFSRKPPAGLSPSANAGDLLKAFDGAAKDPDAFKTNLKQISDSLLATHDFALNKDDMKTVEGLYTAFFSNGPSMSYNTNALKPSTGGFPAPSYIALQSASAADGTNYSFLATEENYRAVRDLQTKNLIIPIVGDFSGPTALRGVGRYLRDHGAEVGAFYVSNVEQYLLPMREGAPANPKGQSFYDTIATMPLNAASVFIRVNGNSSAIPPPRAGTTIVFPDPELASIANTLKAAKDGKIKIYPDLFAK